MSKSQMRRLRNKVGIELRKIRTTIFGKRKRGEYAYPKDKWNKHNTVQPKERCDTFTNWYEEFNIELLLKFRPFNY
jgi:hypothetical protein